MALDLHKQLQKLKMQFLHIDRMPAILIICMIHVLTALVCGVPLKPDSPAIVSYSTESKSNSTELNSNSTELEDTSNSTLFVDGLFEGDLDIPVDLIRKYYNFSSIPGGEKILDQLDKENDDDSSGKMPHLIQKRAAIRNMNKLWTDNIAWYQISENIPMSTAYQIRDALDHWEDHTCLRFENHQSEADYIEFNNLRSGCLSNSIGKKGGMQLINLQ